MRWSLHRSRTWKILLDSERPQQGWPRSNFSRQHSYTRQSVQPEGETSKFLTALTGVTAETRDDIELIFENLPEPIDLDIDTKAQLLYWTDRGELPRGNTLNVANLATILDPTASRKDNTYKTLAWHLHEGIGLVVDSVHQNIYVSDLGGCVYRYDMNGNNKAKLFEDQGVYTGIALAHLPAETAQRLLKDEGLEI